MNFFDNKAEKMEILGFISNIDRSNGKIVSFEITVENNNKQFVYCIENDPNDFLPISVMDKICVKIKRIGDIFRMQHKPFVLISKDKADVLEYLKPSYSTDYITIYKNAEKLIPKYRKHLDEDICAADIFNIISVMLEQCNNDNPISGVSKVFLQRWYNDRVLRQLYLLGLRRWEIRKSGFDELRLFELCLENPFKIYSIPLNTCNEIMKTQGEESTSAQKYCGKIVRWIWEKMCSGWTFVPLSYLEKAFPSYTKYKEVLKEYDVFFDDEEISPSIPSSRIYLKVAYEAEVDVKDFVNELLTQDKDLAIVEFNDSFLFSDEQKNAIIGCLENPFSILTGPAGSGKSTVLKKIIETISENGKTYILTSFTGKAVNRLIEISDGKADVNTLDYLITRRMKNPDENQIDYLIIDEATMCSTEKFFDFITVYENVRRVILCGDCNQLPPISYGNLFDSLIKSKRIPVFELSVVYRVDDESSNILSNCEKLLAASFSETPKFSKGKGYFESFKNNALDTVIKSLYENDISPKDFKILCPFSAPRKQINTSIQELYRERNLEGKTYNHESVLCKHEKFQVGDTVIAIENNYKINVMNGQEGEVCNITSEFVEVEFNRFITTEKIKFYINPKQNSRLPNVSSLELSYSLTVHKAQGSEYPIVILYIPKREIKPYKSAFLNRNLLYTGMSRAKKMLYVVGDKNTFYASMSKIVSPRFEALKERLGYEESEEVFDENEMFYCDEEGW